MKGSHGLPELRLAFYQTANIARQRDPQLAEFYQRLVVERAHHHMMSRRSPPGASVAISRSSNGRG
jgi:hypothetical protein